MQEGGPIKGRFRSAGWDRSCRDVFQNPKSKNFQFCSDFCGAWKTKLSYHEKITQKFDLHRKRALLVYFLPQLVRRLKVE